MATEHIIEQESKVIRKNSEKIKEPEKFKVIVCNDDVTPIEFVVSMLIAIFRYNQKSALDLTMQIHHKGSAIAGIFRYEIAEQKAIDATNLSRSHGWPLIIKIEQE
jgi:ATP-dependent Clp protease adaptor protein ClpS